MHEGKHHYATWQSHMSKRHDLVVKSVSKNVSKFLLLSSSHGKAYRSWIIAVCCLVCVLGKLSHLLPSLLCYQANLRKNWKKKLKRQILEAKQCEF